MPENDDIAPPRVLAGVDGSQASLAAVSWASRMAADTDRTLVLCLVRPPEEVPGELPAEPAITAELQQRAELVFDRAHERALTLAPTARIERLRAMGCPAAELRKLATPGDLLVLGRHGVGWFRQLVIGSTTAELAAYASCPVVTTPVEPPEGAAVVVGVDGSGSTQRTLEFAFAAAAARHGTLCAVHAYAPPPVIPIDRITCVREPDVNRRIAATRLLDDVLAPWLLKYPEIPVRKDIVSGPATRALLEASQHSCLVVVGARGCGGFADLPLGSVAQHLIALAGCPVAIAR